MPKSVEHPVPENLPKFCGHCKSSLAGPSPYQIAGLKLKEGTDPRELKVDKNVPPELFFRWGLFCPNRNCRAYWWYNLGGKPEDEGFLDSKEYEDYVHSSKSSTSSSSSVSTS